MTGFLFSKKDLYLRFDEWKPGDNNILFITGLSGSGKTSLAEKLEDQCNCRMFEIDGIEFCYDATNQGILKEISEEYPAYGTIYREVTYTRYPHQWKTKEYCIIDEVLRRVERKMREDPSHRYIIEGVRIWQHFNSAQFSKEPIIIKGTSYLVSRYGAAKRDKMSLTNFVKNVRDNRDTLTIFNSWVDNLIRES